LAEFAQGDFRVNTPEKKRGLRICLTNPARLVCPPHDNCQSYNRHGFSSIATRPRHALHEPLNISLKRTTQFVVAS
jgi:hypothetical protein